MLNLEMMKKAKANVDAKLAKQAAIDAANAQAREENKSTEKVPVEVNKTVKNVTATEAIKPEKVTVLPGPVKTVEETATGRAAAQKKLKHADVVAEKNTAVLAARGIKHGEVIKGEKELAAELKKGIVVVYAGKPSNPLDAEYNQCWQVKPDSDEPDLFLRFRWLHNGRESGKKENLVNSAAVWNRDKLEPSRLMFGGKWRDVTCYKLA